MIILLSLLIAIAGLVIYAIAVNPKATEIGRIMFWTGLLAFLLQTPQLLTLFNRR